MKIPTEPHFAIITTVTTYIPGDERSRTNPGHGYPEHSVESIRYEAFTDKCHFETKVEDLMRRNKTFRAVQVTPLKYEMKIQMVKK